MWIYRHNRQSDRQSIAAAPSINTWHSWQWQAIVDFSYNTPKRDEFSASVYHRMISNEYSTSITSLTCSRKAARSLRVHSTPAVTAPRTASRSKLTGACYLVTTSSLTYIVRTTHLSMCGHHIELAFICTRYLIFLILNWWRNSHM